MVSLCAGPIYVALTQTAASVPYFLLALPAGSAGALGLSTSKTTFSPDGTEVYSWDSATNTISSFGFNASIAAITNGGSVTESTIVSILPTERR